MQQETKGYVPSHDLKDFMPYMHCHCSLFVLKTMSCKNIFDHLTYAEKMRSSESSFFPSKNKLSLHWRKMLSTERIKILFCEMCARPHRPAEADDDDCFDRLRAMTLVTMYWLVLVELEASMHAPLPELWEWGQYLCTSMLEFCLHMEWPLLMLSMRRRNRVPRYMNQVEKFLFYGLKKSILHNSSLMLFIYSYLVSLSCP
jgi:hypothetical protein